MSVQNSQAAELTPETLGGRSPQDEDSGRTRRAIVNWVLALLTVPAAILVVVFAIGAAMSMAGCSAPACPGMGPSGLVYGVLLYGAPVISVVTLVISIFTAFRRYGFIVPVIALALLLADFATIAALF